MERGTLSHSKLQGTEIFPSLSPQNTKQAKLFSKHSKVSILFQSLPQQTQRTLSVDVWMYVYVHVYVQICIYTSSTPGQNPMFDFAGPTTDNYQVSTWQFSWGNTSHPIPNLIHIQWTLNTQSSCSGGPRPIHTMFLCILDSYTSCLLEASLWKGEGWADICTFQVPLTDHFTGGIWS